MSTRDDFNFANNVRAAMEERAPKTAWVLILSIFFLLMLAFGWSQWAVVEEVTTGVGRVIPSQQLQVVQTLEGGILRKLLVREGDIVDKDQVLIEIDDTGFASELGELRQRRWSYLAQIERLNAEAKGSNTVAKNAVLEKHAPFLAKTAAEAFVARKFKLEEEKTILHQQLIQQIQKLAEFTATQSKLEASLIPLKKEIELTEKLRDQGVVPEVEFLRLERQLAEVEGELSVIRSSIPGAQAGIKEFENRIKNIETAFRTQARERLLQAYGELAITEESLKAAEDKVSRTLLKAPVHGIINKINISSIGAVVAPGRDIIEIVPLDDTMLIEAKIRPQDVAFIGPDQEASIKLTAYDYTVYGSLQGKVERISADTISDAENQTFYLVTVRTNNTDLVRNGINYPIIPGMVAQVDIMTGKKTVFEYLIKPVTKMRQEAFRER